MRWSEDELKIVRASFSRAPWPELLILLPGRSRQAIWQLAKNVLKIKREINKREKWLTDEIIILYRIYPTATDDELRLTFPRHSFIAIQRQASALKILRPRHEARNHRRFVHSVIYPTLRRAMQATPQAQPVKQEIWLCRGTVIRMGKTQPEFRIVCDWAQALGFELTLQKPKIVETIDIPYPSKQQLMGGRS